MTPRFSETPRFPGTALVVGNFFLQGDPLGSDVLGSDLLFRSRFLLGRRLLSAALVGLVLVLTCGQDASAQGAQYPAWFRSMPEPEQALWAVGYARGYDALSAGMDSARADARERLRRNRGMVLRGEKLYESAPGFQMAFEGARFTERALSDTLRSVVYADSLTAGGMTLVLAAWPAPDSLQDSLASSRESSGKQGLSKRALGVRSRVSRLRSQTRLLLGQKAKLWKNPATEAGSGPSDGHPDTTIWKAVGDARRKGLGASLRSGRHLRSAAWRKALRTGAAP